MITDYLAQKIEARNAKVQEATDTLRAFVSKRKAIRKQLLEELRLMHEQRKLELSYTEARKVHRFTSDLSDTRLLELIDRIKR